MPRKKTRKASKAASVPRSQITTPKISDAQLADLKALLLPPDKLTADSYSVAQRTIKMIVSSTTPVDAVDSVLFLLSSVLSVRTLSGYATLDEDHIDDIQALIGTVQGYAKDTSQKRPLNFLMLASPGAGKSHFIKCVARQLQDSKVSAIVFNMTALQKNEDLVPALDNARNLKVEDRIPLLFLDEFDSRQSNIPLLLPLLWDGELNLGQRDLKLGRVIIVLAGSDPSLPAVMAQAQSMRDDISINEGIPKMVDLLSRINGRVVEIPLFYDRIRNVDRRADKACLAIQLLRQRFGEELRLIPRALLRFIVETEFRYSARSIAHLIELIPHKENSEQLQLDDLNLPLGDIKKLRDSSLAYHLVHPDQVHGIVDCWTKASAHDAPLPALTDLDRYLPYGLSDSELADAAPRIVERLQGFVTGTRPHLWFSGIWPLA